MPIFYRVTQKYFNNGGFTSDIDRISAKTKPQNKFEETSICDIYEDYFTDRSDAIHFYESTRGA